MAAAYLPIASGIYYDDDDEADVSISIPTFSIQTRPNLQASHHTLIYNQPDFVTPLYLAQLTM